MALHKKSFGDEVQASPLPPAETRYPPLEIFSALNLEFLCKAALNEERFPNERDW